MSQSSASEALARLVDPSFARPTRIHALPTALERRVYVKREDELSSGIAGCKLRKFASLLPALKTRGVTDIALIGGPNSNNLVAALQLLKETTIRPWLFIREAGDMSLKGNALFLDMLIDRSQVTTIQRRRWGEAEVIAAERLSSVCSDPARAFLLPEGGLCVDSLPGAMTLASDVLRNERESDICFDRIYIDSGTGMSAIGLILGLSLLDESASQRTVKVTLIAGSQEEFEQSLSRFSAEFLETRQLASGALPQLDFLRCPTARKFGQVNQSILATCKRIARSEGLLMDPVYSVKHYMAMQADLETDSGHLNSLFIFNGSALGLCGFQPQLAQIDQ